MAASSGCASAYEIGSTGIFRIAFACAIGNRLAFLVEPTPGVKGSPAYSGMSATEPRCTPLAGRHPPCG